MKGLLFASLLAGVMVATGEAACDMNAMQNCQQILASRIGTPSGDMEQMCQAIKEAVPAFRSCMESVIATCDGSMKETFSKALEDTLKGYAQYDTVCKEGGQTCQAEIMAMAECSKQMQGMEVQDKEEICRMTQTVAQCAWSATNNCPAAVENYKKMYAKSVTMANQNGCNIVIEGAPTDSGSGPGPDPEPNPSNCQGLQGCVRGMMEALGIQGDNYQNLMKDPRFQGLMSFNMSRQAAFCRMLNNVNIGDTMACLQREMKKCMGMDIFESLKSVLAPSGDGQNPGAGLMQLMFKALNLMTSDGAIVPESWNRMIRFQCDPDCQRLPPEQMMNSQCMAGTLSTCSDAQNVLKCVSDDAESTKCSLKAYLVHTMVKPMLEKQLGNQGNNCELVPSVPLPQDGPVGRVGVTLGSPLLVLGLAALVLLGR